MLCFLDVEASVVIVMTRKKMNDFKESLIRNNLPELKIYVENKRI